MKLNREDEHKLRGKIEEELKNVPTGQRVHLDKEILEELLFYKVKIDDNTIAKLPIWSGEFLRKLDLSEVNFDDVSWTYIYDVAEDWCSTDELGTNKIECSLLDMSRYSNETSDDIRNWWDLRKKRLKIGEKGDDGREYVNIEVDFSHTNANIDLTRSFEAKNSGNIVIYGCNFSGLDFSTLDLNKIKKLETERSDISNTCLVIPNDIFLKLCESNLDGIDLSGREITVDIDEDLDYPIEDDKLEFSGGTLCLGLRNTGIHINLEHNNNRKINDLFSCNFDKFEGCYVNGKLIKTSEQRKEIASSQKNKYDKMKNEIFGSITDSIEEQVHHMKR